MLIASCTLAPPVAIHDTVGPIRGFNNKAQNGFLTVYSATAWMTDGDGPSLLSYTDYEIDAADGAFFRRVSNSEQEPARIVLPKGIYTVVAQSDTSGTVRVPVAIETGRTTVLHLEREKDWEAASAGIGMTDLVRLPNGQPIGFRARSELRNASVVAITQSRNGQSALEP